MISTVQFSEKMNKQVNHNLKNLTNWLNTNKICLNISKTKSDFIPITKKANICTLKPDT